MNNQKNKILRVEDAIERGALLIALPVTLIILVSGTSAICAFWFWNYPWYVVIPMGVLGSIIGFVIAFAYERVAMAKWKLWAYSSVDDIVELKRMAVAQKLVNEEGSFFRKLEITTPEIRAAEEEALKRLKKGVVDDESLGESTKIYYKSMFAYAGIILSMFLILCGILLVLYIPSVVFGILLLEAVIVGGFLIRSSKKKIKLNNKLVLELTNEGIYIFDEDQIKVFTLWSDLYHFDFFDKKETQYLAIKGKNIDTAVEFSLTVDGKRLVDGNKLMYLYRMYKLRHRKNFPELYSNEQQENKSQ